MRLRSVEIANVPPIEQFSVSDLADVIVLAGPNGVGKTRLVQALVAAFRQPGSNPNIHLHVEATSPEEMRDWGKSSLDSHVAADAQRLAQTMQRGRRRTHWESSVVQFESDRTNPPYGSFQFSFDAPDPWEEMVGWDSGLTGLKQRYQDTITSIFRKVHSQRDTIAKRALELIRAGGGHFAADEFPDPIAPFKRAFSQLLAPKELLDPEPREQQLYYEYQGNRFHLGSLSSGEREVVNIVFDFLLRDPADSIIIFDEPELHLHPELSYKLLHTLRNAGRRNQFIFVTHSPDIITASLEHSVIFIRPPEAKTNQAVVVREDDDTNEALGLIGQSIGIVALGKRIVLIEGAQTSLDKQTYGAILKDRFPNLVLVPAGGKGLIQSFNTVVKSVLAQALWGIDFFMLCDRDSLPLGENASTFEVRSGGRLRVLKRYHLENYFLEEEILAGVFAELEPDDAWLRNPAEIASRLRSIAAGVVPYATALTVAAHFRERVGNVDLMVKGVQMMDVDALVEAFLVRTQHEQQRVASSAAEAEIESMAREVHARFVASLDDGTWKYLIPGRPILDQFAHIARLQASRLKLRYLAAADRAPVHPFQDVIDIFRDFAEA